jgi:hypothetical protein
LTSTSGRSGVTSKKNLSAVVVAFQVIADMP